jgi:hypothetical protein
MIVRSLGRAFLLLFLVQALSAFAASSAKTFKGSSQEVFAAAEKVLKADPRISEVSPYDEARKLSFGGPRMSWGEHYCKTAGEISVSPSAPGKCMVVVSVEQLDVSLTDSLSGSMRSGRDRAIEKDLADSILRRIGRILKH